MGKHDPHTLNSLIEKFDDYLSEEYVKTLAVNSRSDRKLQNVSPYVGVLSYPSDDFLKPNFAYGKTTQFQNTTYVGHMEFLLPPIVALANVGIAYTLLSFNLDGKIRQFVQTSAGGTTSQGILFKDFVFGLYPNANREIAFNRHALHILTDIEISGGIYNAAAQGTPFQLQTAGSGAFTPSIDFEFSISGYKCLMQ